MSLDNIMFVVQDVDYYAPLGVMQLSAIAKQYGKNVSLGVIEREDVKKKITDFDIDLVAYGGCTGEHKFYTKFNKELMEENKYVRSLVGGPHATYFPEVLEEGNYDVLIRGEAEIEFERLMKEGMGTDWDEKIRGPGLLTEDLDSLPFPDRELFYSNNICLETGQAGNKQFMTGRGCPYQCTYCFNSSDKEMFKGQKRIRKHSVDYVIDEIKETIKKYPLQTIKFYDDIFVQKQDKKWLEEFAEKYPKEIGIPFFTMMRFDILTEDNVKLLKKAGCKALQCSIESVNPRIRNDILKRNMSMEQMMEGINLVRDNGITLVPNAMLGLPTSTLQDDIDNINFVCDNKLGYCDFPIYQPYPKTELGEYCVENKLFDGDFDKMHLSYSHHSVLNCFDDDRKKALKNLCSLGTVASVFPKLKKPLIYTAQKMEYNQAFFTAFYLAKSKFFANEVYNYKHSFKEKWELFKKSIKVETSKR